MNDDSRAVVDRLYQTKLDQWRDKQAVKAKEIEATQAMISEWVINSQNKDDKP